MRAADKVVVTGCSGYIGQWLVPRLVRDGMEVIGIDRDRPEDETLLSQVLPCDLSEKQNVETVANCLRSVDTVIHLAAARTDWGLARAGYERDNVQVTRNLVEASQKAGISRWLYFGTVGVYGASDIAVDESTSFRPDTDYGATKAQAENELLKAATEHGWNVRIIRPSAVFSEKQPKNTNLYRLIEAIRQHRFVLIGDGSEIKTTSYLHNVVDAAMWLYEDIASGGIKAYNYVDEPRMTTREMVDRIRAVLGISIPLVRLPLSLVERPARVLDWIGNRVGRDFPITAARIRKFCTATNFDSSKIRNEGFVAAYSSEEALKRAVEWHKRPLGMSSSDATREAGRE